MQRYSTTTSASGSEFGRSGAALNVNTRLGPTESSAPAAADPPIRARDVEEYRPRESPNSTVFKKLNFQSPYIE
jgi:hypothetical protein